MPCSHRFASTGAPLSPPLSTRMVTHSLSSVYSMTLIFSLSPHWPERMSPYSFLAAREVICRISTTSSRFPRASNVGQVCSLSTGFHNIGKFSALRSSSLSLYASSSSSPCSQPPHAPGQVTIFDHPLPDQSAPLVICRHTSTAPWESNHIPSKPDSSFSACSFIFGGALTLRYGTEERNQNFCL